MRVGSFLRDGTASYGVFVADGVVDLGRRLGGAYPDLLSLVRKGALDEARAAAEKPADLPVDRITFLPVVPAPVNIFCAGRNYKDHLAEMGAEPPPYPTLFMKLQHALVGHGQPLIRPRISEAFDYEAELCAVIGKPAYNVAREDALDHVAGYTCLMDGSIRDFQRRSTDQGKNFYHSSAVGPWMATPDEVPPPAEMRIQGRLNGEVMQDSTIDQLIFDVADLIAYYSQITLLEAGDMISTGTCGGVGAARTPPVWLKPGDVFETEITGIGTLSNPVAEAV